MVNIVPMKQDRVAAFTLCELPKLHSIQHYRLNNIYIAQHGVKYLVRKARNILVQHKRFLQPQSHSHPHNECQHCWPRGVAP
eukprot:2224478-Pyramimonas_sp.AAC.1